MPYSRQFYNNFFKLLNILAQKYNFKLKKNNHWDGGELWDARFKRLNITIFADFYKYSIQLSTEVGVSGGGYNERLYEKLYRSPNNVKNIENNYDGCIFDRHIRLYNYGIYGDTCRYFWIKNFKTLSDYLKIVDNYKVKIALSKRSQANCLNDLTALNANNWAQGNNMQGIALTPQQVLKDWDFEPLHWLEYLRIIESVDVSTLAEGDINSVLKTLEPIIEKHLRGMDLINDIEPALL